MILKNFLYDIAGCSGTFTVENRELQCIRDIKEKVGSSKVLVSIYMYIYILVSKASIQKPKDYLRKPDRNTDTEECSLKNAR